MEALVISPSRFQKLYTVTGKLRTHRARYNAPINIKPGRAGTDVGHFFFPVNPRVRYFINFDQLIKVI